MSGRMRKQLLVTWLGASLVAGGAGAWAAGQSGGTASPAKTSSKLTSSKKAPARQDGVKAQNPATANFSALKSQGSKSAPITIEVFSDYECPSCRAFFLETQPSLERYYVATGKVYFTHRDFVLTAHKFSREAARYANAAALIGKFDAVNAVLFDRQPTWASTAGAQTDQVDSIVASVLTPAEMIKVRELAKDKAIDAAIQKDYDLGVNVHRVNQTPTLIVTLRNGQMVPIVGAVPYPVLKQYLDEQLRQ